jgi:HSP20 family molecular chaperone IbpA
MSLLPERFYLDDFFDDFAPMRKMPKFDNKCDIYEKGGNVHIELEIPGYDKKNIKLDVENGVLTVEGHTDIEKEDKEKKYFRKERVSGSFRRKFTIGDVNEKDIHASFNNGVLKVSFPKEQKKESKKYIQIN